MSAAVQSPVALQIPAKTPMRQGTLASFVRSASTTIKKTASYFKPKEYSDDDEEEFEENPVSDGEEEHVMRRHVPENKSKSTIDGGANVKGPMDMRHLPPINDLNEMFADLVNNPHLRGIEDLVNRLDGRKLRVATMCSGTESPLLVSCMATTTSTPANNVGS